MAISDRCTVSVRVTVAIVCVLMFLGMAMSWFEVSNTFRRKIFDDALWPAIASYSTPGTTNIGLIVATRSYENDTMDTTPLFTIFLPSFLRSIATDVPGAFDYTLYFGFDIGDPLFDNLDNLIELKARFARVVGSAPVSLKTFANEGTKGLPVHVWNRLARSAINDGVDYVFQLNDDIFFYTAGWAPILVQKLRNNPVHPNLGVTGPLDQANSAIFTQSFVSRVHFEIFHDFYPYIFKNWYSDDWITQVYRPNHLFLAEGVVISNVNREKSRYEVEYAASKYLDLMVENGRITIEDFLIRQRVV